MTEIMPHVGAGVASAYESRFAFSNRDSSKSLDRLAGLIRAMEPVKPAAALAEYAGIGLRAAELFLQGRAKSLSGRSIVNLLRSRIGDRVLDALLGERPPAWRAAEVRLMGVAALEAELEQLEQKRRHLEALIERRRE